MDELMAALEQAFADYLQDLENYEKKRKPTDGLLGFGHSLQNDPCHERLDHRVEDIIRQMCVLSPVSKEAEQAVRRLLLHEDAKWPLAAQWMLRALERHPPRQQHICKKNTPPATSPGIGCRCKSRY